MDNLKTCSGRSGRVHFVILKFVVTEENVIQRIATYKVIAQVTNLVQTIKQLQEQDVWIAGMDLTEESQPLGSIDLDRALGIVVGHEGSGLRRLVGESCDFLVMLPQRGHVESLNAAVAGSILIYAAWQARGFPGTG